MRHWLKAQRQRQQRVVHVANCLQRPAPAPPRTVHAPRRTVRETAMIAVRVRPTVRAVTRAQVLARDGATARPADRMGHAPMAKAHPLTAHAETAAAMRPVVLMANRVGTTARHRVRAQRPAIVAVQVALKRAVADMATTAAMRAAVQARPRAVLRVVALPQEAASTVHRVVAIVVAALGVAEEPVAISAATLAVTTTQPHAGAGAHGMRRAARAVTTAAAHRAVVALEARLQAARPVAVTAQDAAAPAPVGPAETMRATAMVSPANRVGLRRAVVAPPVAQVARALAEIAVDHPPHARADAWANRMSWSGLWVGVARNALGIRLDI